MLYADDAVGRHAIYVAYSDCVGRGLDNGARRAQVSRSLLNRLMAPLYIGYASSGDLP